MNSSTWRWSTNHGLPPFILIVGLTSILLLLGLTAPVVELDLGRLLSSSSRLLEFASHWLTQPDWAYLPTLAVKLLETLQIGVVATAIALIFSLPIGVLAARNTSPHPVLYHISRNGLSLMRALPDLVWALMFVSAVGLGPLPGVMALTFVTVGFMAKFFAESMEVIDSNGVVGVTATGANQFQILMFAVFPLALPDFLGTLLYILDHNIRAATILGLVGAGGIGYELVMSMRLFNYSRLILIALSIYLMVTILDRLSDQLRSRVI